MGETREGMEYCIRLAQLYSVVGAALESDPESKHGQVQSACSAKVLCCVVDGASGTRQWACLFWMAKSMREWHQVRGARRIRLESRR